MIQKNYKTIFTFLYELTPGDEINVNIENVIYKYKVKISPLLIQTTLLFYNKIIMTAI
jgi:hypothetical protein